MPPAPESITHDRSGKIDPICGMTGTIPAHQEWFCSIHCLRKYELEMGLSALPESLIECAPVQDSLFRDKLFLTFASLVLLLFLSFFLPSLQLFRHHFTAYASLIWRPLLLGFLIGGIIEVYIPRSYVSKILNRAGSKTIFSAAGLGFIFSGCSHGCLAIAFELYKKGASVPAVISFLLASPWANASITILLLSFFGMKGALIIAAALIISVCTGLGYVFLDKKNWIEKNPNTQSGLETFSIFDDLKKRWKNYRWNARELFLSDFQKILIGAWHLVRMVLWWVLIGMTLAAFIGAYLPATLFQKWMAKDLTGMCVTLALATVIEICSEGSAPLAFEIYRQTHALGNTFLFLMAGVVTDYTEIGLLWSNVGKKTAFWLPAIAVPLTFLIGFLLNLWF